MSRVSLKELVSESKRLFSEWPKEDIEGLKFLPSYSKPEEWLHLIDNKKRFTFIAYINEVPFGFFDFEINKDRGHFTIYVSKSYRGKGLAKEILREAFKLECVNSVDVLDVGVEKENVSSISLLKEAGFRESVKDEDGILVYLKEKPFLIN